MTTTGRQTPDGEPAKAGATEPPPGEARPPSAAENAAEDREASLAAMEARLAEADDRLLRSLAEQQNMRRIAAREHQETIRYAASKLAADLLESIDNLERALKSASEAPDSDPDRLLQGVAATQEGLLAALARHGVKRLDPLGEPFDPERHHAVYERPEPSADDGTVIEVLQPGYLIHDRLLRPAMVGVANNSKITQP
ncbi:MAG TPA: nucleotide exchange factor GrpE [Devosiaceae bacterium]|nr:nucleotide exchange factor GrpE [Devosiaceae bacterium]